MTDATRKIFCIGLGKKLQGVIKTKIAPLLAHDIFHIDDQ